MLKGESVNLWISNILLALYGTGFAALGMLYQEGPQSAAVFASLMFAVLEHGFFHGYNNYALYTVLLQVQVQERIVM